jgi:hypothetical protein
MNETFEILPFADRENELEEERWGRGGARFVGRGGGARFSHPARHRVSAPGQRGGYPRRRPLPPRGWGWPAPFPVSGWGWPYGVYPAARAAEPPPMDAGGGDAQDMQDAQQGQDAQDGQGEMPPLLSATPTRMPAAQRPDYQLIGALPEALRDARATGPGLYMIEFDSSGRRRGYSGHSGNLRRRLQQHALCARMMGIDSAGHQVYVASMPSSTEAQRRGIEERIHDDMLVRHAGVLTNQRRELEWEFSPSPRRRIPGGMAPVDVRHAAGCACPACGGFEVMNFRARRSGRTRDGRAA